MNKNINVPTTIISGFLGSGKTTLVKQLLSKKPSTENWLLIINEFGIIGLDGKDIEKSTNDDVLEIPGGCLCCDARLPLQMTMARALRKSTYDRVIIEPTGLAHLYEAQSLIRNDFKGVLSLMQTVCILDAKNLQKEKVWSLDLFKNQIICSDLLIANKVSTYDDQDKSNLKKYLETIEHSHLPIEYCDYGELDYSHIFKDSTQTIETEVNTHHHHHDKEVKFSNDFIIEGFYKKAEDAHSLSLKFSPTIDVNERLFLLLGINLGVDRMKGFLCLNGSSKSVQYDGFYFDIKEEDASHFFLDIIYTDDLSFEAIVNEFERCLLKK